MKNFSIRIFILIIFVFSLVFSTISYAEESEEFVPVTYLDTDVSFDIPDVWLYEGVLYNKDYSQKKYTNVKNLSVSILFGMRNLKDEIKKKMPFIPVDNLLNSLSEESLVNILGSASNSTIEEKVYGNNKFYEFFKTQKNDKGEDVNCIVDMMVEGDNIYSFSYIYRDEKFAINDYGKVLTSFKTGNRQIEEKKEPEVIETKTEPEENNEKIEPIIEEIKEEKEPEKVPEKEEVKEEAKTEPQIEEIKEEVKEEAQIEPIESNLSGNIETIPEITEITPEEIFENPEEPLEEDEVNFEDMGIVQNTYKPKSWIESVGSIILGNPVLVIGIIVLATLEIMFWRHIKKKKNNKTK